MITDKIKAYLEGDVKYKSEEIADMVARLSKYSFSRHFFTDEKKDASGKLWLSQVGKCARQTAYKFHGIEEEGKQLDARAKTIFWLGDSVELTVIALAKLAGVPLIGVGGDQFRLSIPLGINEFSITGRPDGILASDKIRLFECKSMSSYAFESFQKGDIDLGYLVQVNLEMLALKINETVFVAVAKDSGEMDERIVPYDAEIAQYGLNQALAVVKSTADFLPPSPVELNPSKKGIYPWQCLYCGFWKKCRPNAEKVLIGSNYKLKEKELSNA